MKRSMAVLALLLTAAACSDSGKATGPEEVTMADLVGSWTAASQTYTNNAEPGINVDIINLGGETRVTILDGGRARTWVDLGTLSDEWDAQLAISGNTLTSTPAEATRSVRTWTFSLEGNVLTLTDANWSFDFTLTGATGVSATEKIVLERQ